ncbi:hypothetical protein ACLOJK_018457 [Asimina triloba]
MPPSGEKSKQSDTETKSPFGFEGGDWSCSWKRKRRRKDGGDPLGIQESEEGREVQKLQSSACEEDTGKQTRVCDRQRLTVKACFERQLNMMPKNRLSRRMKKEEKFGNYGLLHVRKTSVSRHRLTENMLQMNVATVQHAIDLKPTDDIVFLDKDLQLEQITNTSEKIGSASDFQSAGGKDEKLKAIHYNERAVRRSDYKEHGRRVLEPLGIQESEEGREVGKLQSSACGEDTVKHATEDLIIQKSEEGRKRKSEASAWGKDTDCKTWQEEQEAEIAQSIMDDLGDGADIDNISPSPMEVSGHKMWKMMKEHWEPWGKELQPPYSSQVVKDYCGISLEKKGIKKLKLREEDDFSVLKPLVGSQDSRKAIQEDERVRRSANDYIIGNKVHNELSDLLQDPVERVSDNQESAHDGRRCMDASLSSTNLVEVTKVYSSNLITATGGGSNSDAQQGLSR